MVSGAYCGNVAMWQRDNRVLSFVVSKSQIVHLKWLNSTFERRKCIVELSSTFLTLGREKQTLLLCSRLIETFTYFKRLVVFH